MEIQEIKKVWVAWTNTDCTEGRGRQYPLCVAESLETAKRLGKGGSVQGTDCHTTEGIAVKINGQWLVPGHITSESEEDKQLRWRRETREAAVEKAKAAGLSDKDIRSLIE